MKKRLWLSSLSLLTLLLVISACAPKKTVKPTEETKPAAQNLQPGEEGTPSTEASAAEESKIQPETSAKGMNFVEVTNMDLPDVYFDLDKYNLSEETKAALAKSVEVLKNNSKTVIQVEGHCDERGTVEYNLALGQKRATAVRNYLVIAGIDSARIFTISYGKEKPLDPGHNEEAWAKNRRAHFVVAAN
jgi:peptidoglycan-associated lipoprotein